MKAKKIMAGTLAAAMTVGGGALPISTIASVMTASAANDTPSQDISSVTDEQKKAAQDIVNKAAEALKSADISYTSAIAAKYAQKADVATAGFETAVNTALTTAKLTPANFQITGATYEGASIDSAAKVTYKITYTDPSSEASADATVATTLTLTPEQKVDAALTLVTSSSIAGFTPSNKDNDESVTAAVNKAIEKTGAKLFGKIECDYKAAEKGVEGSIKTKNAFSIYAGVGDSLVTKTATLDLAIAKLNTDDEDVAAAKTAIETYFGKYKTGEAAFKSTDTDATIEKAVKDLVETKYNVRVTLSTVPSGRTAWYVPATTDKEGSFAATFLIASKSSNVSATAEVAEFKIDKLKSNADKAADIAKVLAAEFKSNTYTLPSTATKANVDTFVKAVVSNAVGTEVDGVKLTASDLDGVSFVWGTDGNYNNKPASFKKDGTIYGTLNVKCGDATEKVTVAENKIVLKNSAKEDVEAVKVLADKAIKNLDLTEGSYTTAKALEDAIIEAIKEQKISDNKDETTAVSDDQVTYAFDGDVQFTAADKTEGKFTAKIKYSAKAVKFTNIAGKFEYNDADYTDTVAVNLVLPLSKAQKLALVNDALAKVQKEYPTTNRSTLDELLTAVNDALKATGTGYTATAAGSMTSEDANYKGAGFKTFSINIADGNTLVAQKTLKFNIPQWLTNKEALEAATKAVNTALASLTVTNTTTTSEVLDVIKKTIAPYEGVGIDSAATSLTITPATKTAKGSIAGTVKLTTPDATLSSVVNVNVAIPVLAMTDAEKLDAAKTLLDETFANFKTSNATQQADVTKAASDALAKSDNLKDVISSIVQDTYKKVDATKDAEGSITGTFTLKVNDSTATYDVNLKIKKLDKNDEEKATEIKNAINDAIAAYEKNSSTTLNATKQDEFTAMVEKAATDLGYKVDGKDVKITISDFKVNPSTTSNLGTIRGSIDILRGTAIKHIDIHVNIPQLPTDEQKLATATGAAKEALAAVKSSNETTADSILDAVKAAIVKADVDVAADWSADAPFTIKKATETEDGVITGSIVLKSGDKTETVAVNLPIAKLVLTDAEKAENAKKIAEEALKNFTATNDTIETDVTTYLAVALKDSAAATATIANFNVLKSTVDAEGKVTGTVTIKVGENGTATIELALPIAKIEAPTVAGVVLNKTYTNSTSAIRIKWDAAEGVDGYEVYKNGTLAGNVQAGEFLATGLAAGTTYKFTVKAYKTVDGVKYYSDESEALAACTKPKATTITGFVSRATKTVKVAWHSVTGPTSYQVQISADKTFKTGVKNAYVSYKSERSYTTKVSKSKTTYYVRVRACKRSGGNVYRSAWSPVKTVKTK